ncbi:MAG TPA: hypothetical protein VKB35_00520, partial [Ktedonobacteraceae bacterium]|nr:hypothetical protein [Ktedonobacteraceae bacterium]
TSIGRLNHMTLWNNRKGKVLIIAIVVLVCSALIATFAYRIANTARVIPPTATLPPKTPTIGITPATPPTALPTPTPLPLGPIRGIESNLTATYANIPWVRYGYQSCGGNKLSGDALRGAIATEHSRGIRVLITTCQSNGASLYNTAPLNDIAQSRADAVQCGNEEMKYDPGFTTYVPPENFARYFDLCERTMHAVSPDMPVLLGSLDPLVAGADFQKMVNQVAYLNTMQAAMNSSVHPGGHWSWQSQTLGLIDSWHNGYPGQSTNNLYGALLFWAQQFNVNLNNGELGKHIWVVEGTGCYIGCGINPYSPYQVAVSHILTLIVDVQTALSYQVPFFYFTSRDFYFTAGGGIAPFGIEDVNGHPKPLRQDLPMGARALTMSCSSGQVVVINQEQLLGELYAGCKLPDNYFGILTS